MLSEVIFFLIGFSVVVNVAAVALLIKVWSDIGDLTELLADQTREVDPVAAAQAHDWRANVL